MTKYEVGMELVHNDTGIRGIVVPNFKLPGDVCVTWETGFSTSYDPESLDENCSIIDPESTNTDI